jgi:hypothetical protein
VAPILVGVAPEVRLKGRAAAGSIGELTQVLERLRGGVVGAPHAAVRARDGLG